MKLDGLFQRVTSRAPGNPNYEWEYQRVWAWRENLFAKKSANYRPMRNSKVPVDIRLALLPDYLGLNKDREGYFINLESSGILPSISDYDYKNKFNFAEMFYVAFDAIGTTTDLDDFHERRDEISSLLGFDVRYDYNKDGMIVLFPMYAGNKYVNGTGWWDSPYDDEIFDLGGGKSFLEALFDGDYAVDDDEEEEEGEKEVDALPEVMTFNNFEYVEGGDGCLAKGYLYFGENFYCDDEKSYWVKIEKMAHTLVMGISGMGKSYFLQQVMQGILYNIDMFDRVYLVDLKGGVELARYDGMGGGVVRCVYRYDELPGLVDELVATVESRLERMRTKGIRTYKGKRILFIVDEYAQIQLQPVLGKDAKDEKERMLLGLNKLSMLGRAAGLTIWAQLQKGTTDVMDSSFRTNLQSQICFRVANKATAASMFGSTDALKVDPTRLRKGQFVFYDESRGVTTYLQARVVEEKEVVDDGEDE